MPFVKGHPGYKKKGTLNRETITKLERRAIFEKETQERWLEIIKKLPPTYVADQFMGKAEEKIDITTMGDKISLAPEVIAKAEELLKQKKVGE